MEGTVQRFVEVVLTTLLVTMSTVNVPLVVNLVGNQHQIVTYVIIVIVLS